MNEKQPIQVSLTAVLLVFAIIALVAMGFYTYKLSHEKTTATEEVANLNSQVDNLQDTVHNLQGKLDTISNSIGTTNTTAPENTTTSTSTTKSLSDAEAKNILAKFLALYGTADGCPSEILVSLGLINSTNSFNNATRTSDLFVKTNIQYSTYQESMLKYVSEECFNLYFTKHYKEINGILYYKDGFASPYEYDIDKISNQTNGKYTGEIYLLNQEGERTSKANIEFEIVNSNGNYIINSYMEK